MSIDDLDDEIVKEVLDDEKFLADMNNAQSKLPPEDFSDFFMDELDEDIFDDSLDDGDIFTDISSID